MQTSELAVDPNQRRDNRSTLLKTKSKLLKGQKYSFCPYDQTVAHLDPQGYCDHLIGFTNESVWSPGATFEPMVKIKGGRIIQGWNPQPLLKTDELREISISSRVYRQEGLILEGDVRYVPPPSAESIATESTTKEQGRKRTA